MFARQHCNVLCVDDNEQLLEILQARLSNAGYDVDLASNGFRAVAKISGKLDKYRIVILDLRMPGLDGISVIEQTRELGFGGQFVIYAGGIQGDQRQRLADLGVRHVIDKPGAAGELLDAVKQAQDCF